MKNGPFEEVRALVPTSYLLRKSKYQQPIVPTGATTTSSNMNVYEVTFAMVKGMNGNCAHLIWMFLSPFALSMIFL